MKTTTFMVPLGMLLIISCGSSPQKVGTNTSAGEWLLSDGGNADRVLRSGRPAVIHLYRQTDFRQHFLTRERLRILIARRQCVIDFLGSTLRDGSRYAVVEVALPKTVEQVLKEAGMSKFETQLRILKKNKIVQLEKPGRWEESTFKDVVVEPGDVIVDTLITETYW